MNIHTPSMLRAPKMISRSVDLHDKSPGHESRYLYISVYLCHAWCWLSFKARAKATYYLLYCGSIQARRTDPKGNPPPPHSQHTHTLFTLNGDILCTARDIRIKVNVICLPTNRGTTPCMCFGSVSQRQIFFIFFLISTG